MTPQRTTSATAFYLVFPVSRTSEEHERLEPPIKFELVLDAVSEASTLATYYRGVVVAEVFESENAGHCVVQAFGDVSKELIDAFAATEAGADGGISPPRNANPDC